MMASGDVSARRQLADLAADAKALQPWPIGPRLRAAEPARAAAVLVLFGVMDRLPADREAQARAVSRDLDVLLLARAATLSSHPGQVAFPGGRIDDEDDGPVAAALREAAEETGLDPDGVDVLGVLEPLAIPVTGFVVTPVVGWWKRQSPVGVIDHAESADVFRAPVAELLAPQRRVTTRMRRDGRTWRGPGFLVASGGQEHLVWGFTALVLDRLFDALGWTEAWDRDRTLDLP
ncbi:MAG: CoA pyrophosphatase [Microbacterium sp.]|uniref:NUDIX hydrolase n=1 Tax=Microbacterium sp. TaxID=51671 RepID=UPI0039E238CA